MNECLLACAIPSATSKYLCCLQARSAGAADEVVWLTIVCGVPMSGVHKLASSTAQLSSEFIEWQIVESTIDERCTISTAQLARSLARSYARRVGILFRGTASEWLRSPSGQRRPVARGPCPT